MTLILTNAEVEKVFSMSECIDTFDQAYRALAAGNGLSRPRSDILIRRADNGSFYDLKSMDGVAPEFDTAAIRVGSDVLQWMESGGRRKRVQVPVAAGGFYSGLVFLFSVSTTELIAIMPDGVLQRMRVGATNGLAAKYLARGTAETVGLIGSGWQAGAQLMAITAVRQCRSIRCFSRSEVNRLAFCKEMSARIGIDVTPVASAKEAIGGADIVMCATSSVGSVLLPEWLEPGMHLSAVKRTEVAPEVVQRADRVVIHSEATLPTYIHAPGTTPPEQDADNAWERHVTAARYPTLADLVSGQAEGRQSEREVTAFINNIGTGYQFAVAGALVYRKARHQGLGQRLPSELFTQAERP